MGLDRAPIEFQTFYFSHVWLVPPSGCHWVPLGRWIGSTHSWAKGVGAGPGLSKVFLGNANNFFAPLSLLYHLMALSFQNPKKWLNVSSCFVHCLSLRVGKTKDHRIVAQQSYSPLFWDSFLNLVHKVLFFLLCWNKLLGNFWNLKCLIFDNFIHDETGNKNKNWIVHNHTAMFIISLRKQTLPQCLKLFIL